MRLAVLSDIHGNLPALQAVLADARRAGVDAVVNLGDIASGPLWPRETVDFLQRSGWPTLAGNHERQVLAAVDNPAERDRAAHSDRLAASALAPAHIDWLRSLPPVAWLGADVFLCHGTPGSDVENFLDTVTPDFGVHGSPGVRAATVAEAAQRLGTGLGKVLAGRPAAQATLVLCGHTHQPRVLQVPGGPLVVNAGSVGLPAFDHDLPHPHRMETGSPHARYALVERSPERTTPGWHVALRAVAYDWAAAAQRAESQGRGDWADALRSGRVGRLERDVVGP